MQGLLINRPLPDLAEAASRDGECIVADAAILMCIWGDEWCMTVYCRTSGTNSFPQQISPRKMSQHQSNWLFFTKAAVFYDPDGILCINVTCFMKYISPCCVCVCVWEEKIFGTWRITARTQGLFPLEQKKNETRQDQSWGLWRVHHSEATLPTEQAATLKGVAVHLIAKWRESDGSLTAVCWPCHVGLH